MSGVCSDERTIEGFGRLVAAMGPTATGFTLAWLAGHRRIRSLWFGGKRLGIVFMYDPKGGAAADLNEFDYAAIEALVWPERVVQRLSEHPGADYGARHRPCKPKKTNDVSGSGGV